MTKYIGVCSSKFVVNVAMDTLRNMRVFVRVAETGSFTAAADSMDSTVSAMSRSVSELEGYLRTRLMNRSTRRLALTDAGERYLGRCLAVLADVSEAEEEARRAHEQPSGALHVHSFLSVGQHYVLPAVARYRAMYPEVTVTLKLSQRMPDMFDGGSDVAVIGAAGLPNSDLISLQLGTTFSILCASPSYVRARGMPSRPSDVAAHECVILQTPAFPANRWSLGGPNGRETIEVGGSVHVNNAESLMVAVREGLGIGMLPLYVAIDALLHGTLVRVLPNYIMEDMNIYALYPSRRFVDAKIRTWIELLHSDVPKLIAADQAVLANVDELV